jgi:hypothetical protein
MCFVQTPEMLRLIAGEQRGQLYESRLHWQRKFVDRHLAHDNLAAPFRYGKPQNYGPDNVKTSPKRQVKAQISHDTLRRILFFLSFLLRTVNAADEANLIFVNGNVHTVSERQRHAEAVAVKSQRIVFVGSNEDAKSFRGNETRIVDLDGKTVVPGLTDSHCHIFGIGEREMNLNLEGTNTREDFLAKVKARVTQTPPGKWITGRGWIETFWKPPRFPTQQDLDSIAPD